MTNRTLVLFALCTLAVTAVEARVAERRAQPRARLAVEPEAPVADRLPLLVRNSLAAHPIEPIPVGEFGPFGVTEDTAPVAPAADPGWSVLDLRTDPDPGDASAPATPNP